MYPSQPLTLLHQIDVLLLVYASQPGWPAARTAAAAKVIRKVKNLYIQFLKTLWNNWKPCNIQIFNFNLSKKKVYSRQDYTIIWCQILYFQMINFPLLSFMIWLIPQMSATFRAVFGNFEKKLIFITPRGNKYLRFFQNSVLTVQNQLKSYWNFRVW